MRVLRLYVGACFLCLAIPCALSAHEYDVIWMPEGVSPTGSRSNQLNHFGQVAVRLSGADGGLSRAARWSPGKPAPETVAAQPPKWDGLRTSAINDLGNITGTGVSGGNHLAGAFLWVPRDQDRIELLPMLARGQIAPSDINNRNQIVGWASVAVGGRHAFLWIPGEGTKDMGSLSADGGSAALAINETGWVVGSAVAPDGQHHPFRWSAATGMVDLGFPPGLKQSGFACDINDHGEILVNITLGEKKVGKTHHRLIKPYKWTEHEGYMALPCPDGFEDVRGISLNNRGDVLLNARIPPGKGTRGFLVQDGELRPLPNVKELGYTYYMDLNDRGWLIGRTQPGEDEPGFIAKPRDGRANNGIQPDPSISGR